MKWRVLLTVLFVLTLFGGFAYLYVNTFVRKHQHAVILFVVPGLDLNLVNLARQQIARNPQQAEPDDPAIGDARRRAAYRSGKLNLDTFWNLALLGLQEPGQPVPDAGVDATALACGTRVENGSVAIAHDVPLRSLIYAAQQTRRTTGLVTTASLFDPTVVAFYSNIKGQPDADRNANALLYSGIDIILGGGEENFLPASATNEAGRRDNRNLFDEAKARAYTIVRSREELDHVTTWRTRQLLGVFAPGSFYFASLSPEHPRQPSLAEMTRVAISSLNYNINGYFLVVEHGLIARAAEQNLTKLGINEVAEVDEAIRSAVDYAGPDALVIVTNSYSLGAVSAALPAPDLPAPAVATSKVPVTNQPAAAPEWQAGPGGPPLTKTQETWLGQREAEGWYSTNAPSLLQPAAAYRWQTQAMPTAEPAWAASRGEGSDQLRGFIDNTDVFDIVSEQF
jgi:alkaline phosphatase